MDLKKFFALLVLKVLQKEEVFPRNISNFDFVQYFWCMQNGLPSKSFSFGSFRLHFLGWPPRDDKAFIVRQRWGTMEPGMT